MRSATSSILFKDLPTEDEIRAHERRVQEKLQRKGVAASRPASQERRSGADLDLLLDEEKSVEAIRRLENTLYWVMGLAVVALTGVAYVIYMSWISEPQAATKKPLEKSRLPPGVEAGTGDVYVFENGGLDLVADFSFLNSLLSAETAGETEKKPASTPQQISAQPLAKQTSRPPQPEPPVSDPDSETKNSSWWSFDNVMRSIFGEDAKKEKAKAVLPTVVDLRTERSRPAQVPVPIPVQRPAPRPSALPAPEPHNRALPMPRQTTLSQSTSTQNTQVAQDFNTQSSPDPAAAPRLRLAKSVRLETFTARYSIAAEAVKGKRTFGPADLSELNKLETSDEIFQTAAEKFAVREKVFSITAKLNSLDYDTASRAREEQLLISRMSEATAALRETQNQLNEERRIYGMWAEMARGLQNENVVSVATELSSLSEDIAGRKKVYDKASNKYLNAAEQSSSAAVTLGRELQARREELWTAAANFIQWNLSQQLTNLLNLSLLADSLQNTENRIGEQLRILRSPVEGNREDLREELIELRDEFEAELLTLGDTLSDEREELLRRVWALNSPAF
jgi:hypothetical protein